MKKLLSSFKESGFIRYEDYEIVHSYEIEHCNEVSFYANKKDLQLELLGTLPIKKTVTIWGYKSVDVTNLNIPHGTTILFWYVRKIIGIDEFAKNNKPFKYDFCESNISCLNEAFWSNLDSETRMVIDHCHGLKSINGLAGIHTLNLFSSYIKDEDTTNLSKCQYSCYRCKNFGYNET